MKRIKVSFSTWVLLLAPLILFLPGLVRGEALYWGTPALQFIPWRAHAWELLRQGVLPLWNDLSGMGAPLLANYQLALFYPPAWLLFLFAVLGGVPWMAWAHTLLVVAHLGWAGIGTARLLRSAGVSELGQTLGGLAFALSGALVARAGFFNMIWTAAWLPWVLLYTDRIALLFTTDDKAESRLSPGLIFSLGMMLLAGHAQWSWYTILLTAAWVGLGGWRQNHWRGWMRAWGVLAAGGVAAAAISAIQLLPTAEYLLQSQRASAVDYTVAMSYSFWPWRLLGLLAPDLFGNPGLGDYWGYASFWEDAIYIGVLPFLLALSTLKIGVKKPPVDATERRWQVTVRFLWIVILVGVVLGLGQFTPIFPFLYRHIPTFAMFHGPARYMLWVVFALSLLCGIGAEGWKRPIGRGLKRLRQGTVAAAGVTIGAFAGWYVLSNLRAVSLVRGTALAGFWGLGAGVLTLMMPRQGDRGRWEKAAILWVAVDLLAAGWLINPTVGMNFYQPQAAESADIRAQAGSHRVYMAAEDDYLLKFSRFVRFGDYRPIENTRNWRAVMLPQLNLLDSVASANNFDPLIPGRTAQWMSALEKTTSTEKITWLALMDVALWEQRDVWVTRGVSFQQIPAGGRYRWYGCALAASSSGQAVALTREVVLKSAEPANAALVVEGQSGGSPTCSPRAGAQIEEIERIDGHLKLRVDAESAGWLMVADSWFPGWVTKVDGKETPTLPAYTVFRAVQVPAGVHEIVQDYRPRSFQLGWMITLASLLIAGLWGWNSRKKSGKVD